MRQLLVLMCVLVCSSFGSAESTLPSLQQSLVRLDQNPRDQEAVRKVREDARIYIDRRTRALDERRLELLGGIASSDTIRVLGTLDQARRRLWRDRCGEAARAVKEEQWFEGFQVYLTVLEEAPYFEAASRGLIPLQEEIEAVISGATALGVADRYALEGYLRYSRGQWGGAAGFWEKTEQVLSSLPKGEREPLRRRYGYGRFFERALARREAERRQAEENARRALEADRAKHLALENQRLVQSGYQQGVWLFGRGRYDDALRSFEKVMNADPGHPGAKTYVDRIRAERQKGRDPALAEKHYWRGIQAMALGRVEEAMREWETSLRHDPAFERARVSLDKVARAQTQGDDSLWEIVP